MVVVQCFLVLSVIMFSEALNLAKTAECGIARARRNGKIVGGVESPRGEYPFTVSLKKKLKNGQMKHVCGATLISERFVLTAAHCLPDPVARNVWVTIREYHMNFPEIGEQEQLIRPDVITRHAGFSYATLQNDIALLRLRSAVELRSETLAAAACLPDDNLRNYVGEFGITTGWGRLSETGPRSERLMKVAVPIINNAACAPKLAPYFEIGPGQMCAGYEEGMKDACQGDSGGPLYQTENGQTTLIGVVSIGVGCARPGLPGVYTKVGAYLDWIQRNMR